nr:Transmembrane protein 129 [Hymenolepis microstoma]
MNDYLSIFAGYFLSLRLFGNPEVGLLNIIGNYGVITSLALVITAWTYIHLVWYSDGKWTGHPTMKELKKIAHKIPSPNTFPTSDEMEFLQSHRSPGGVVSSIDKEFRMMEKFVAFSGRGLTSSWSGRRIVVTPSWILYSHRTKFLPISQLLDRIQAVVVATRCINNQTLSPDGDEERESSDPLLGSGVVMATIRIADMDSGVCLLSFDLPANEIESFRTHLRCQLAFAQGVSLEPSIIQRFLDVFTAAVHENDSIECPLSMELERCIGCLTTQTNVALRRFCGSSECGSCQCRPMWCETCLGRWFASRLANARVPTSDWLGSRVPCPTCRSQLCVRDIIPLRTLES